MVTQEVMRKGKAQARHGVLWEGVVCGVVGGGCGGVQRDVAECLGTGVWLSDGE